MQSPSRNNRRADATWRGREDSIGSLADRRRLSDIVGTGAKSTGTGDQPLQTVDRRQGARDDAGRPRQPHQRRAQVDPGLVQPVAKVFREGSGRDVRRRVAGRRGRNPRHNAAACVEVRQNRVLRAPEESKTGEQTASET